MLPSPRPGTIHTPLYHEFTSTLPNKAEVEAVLKAEHPLGLGTEDDIAYAALYLASDKSRYMSGAPLVIDGGIYREMRSRGTSRTAAGLTESGLFCRCVTGTRPPKINLGQGVSTVQNTAHPS